MTIDRFIAGLLAAATYDRMCELHPNPGAPFDDAIWPLAEIFGHLAAANDAEPEAA